MDYKLYFIHIPKTAGTSMEQIFYNAKHKYKDKKYCIGICYYKSVIKRIKNYFKIFLHLWKFKTPIFINNF